LWRLFLVADYSQHRLTDADKRAQKRLFEAQRTSRLGKSNTASLAVGSRDRRDTALPLVAASSSSCCQLWDYVTLTSTREFKTTTSQCCDEDSLLLIFLL
jgi:hypothetical protein